MAKPPAPLHMNDPEDRAVHGEKPAPGDGPADSDAGSSGDDTADPSESDPDAPHDRGRMEDGRYVRGIESMQQDLKNQGVVKRWKKGLTQN